MKESKSNSDTKIVMQKLYNLPANYKDAPKYVTEDSRLGRRFQGLVLKKIACTCRVELTVKKNGCFLLKGHRSVI